MHGNATLETKGRYGMVSVGGMLRRCYDGVMMMLWRCYDILPFPLPSFHYSYTRGSNNTSRTKTISEIVIAQEDWCYDTRPPKAATFFNERFMAALGLVILCEKYNLHIFSGLQQTFGRWHRGGKGHRISGYTAGSWFRNRRFRQRRVDRAYRRTTRAT